LASGSGTSRWRPWTTSSVTRYWPPAFWSALRGFDVEIGRVEQLQEQVFHVLAHVAGFGQRGGVADGERDIEDAGECLGQ
jgi:hypothetical protein